jgi:hypothetical protein
MDEKVRGLTICRMVVYRSRTAQYSVPAIITATIDTIADAGVQAYLDSGGARGVPPLNDVNNVHLTVFTPGIPGQRATADDFVGDRADADQRERRRVLPGVGRAVLRPAGHARLARRRDSGRPGRAASGHLDMATPRSVADTMEALIAAGVKGRPPGRHLPDLLAPDPPDWSWPHACHEYGHVWEVGGDRCVVCRAPFSEFGPNEVEVQECGSEVTTTVRLS